jgi:glutathione S-transferase
VLCLNARGRQQSLGQQSGRVDVGVALGECPKFAVKLIVERLRMRLEQERPFALSPSTTESHMKLLIGNKNYSGWSMRTWVMLTEFGIPFDEVTARFDSFSPDSTFKATVSGLSPAGKVPILVEDDGFCIWDTLAIAEYVAERFPEKALWPRDPKLRARARSVCAEMHSGFGALRDAFAVNIEASLPEVGARILAENAEARDDLARMVALLQGALSMSGGPFLFGDYSIADAYFSPVVTRLKTYELPVPVAVAGYMSRLLATEGVAAWIRGALDQRDFVQFEEPYRTSRD